MVWKNEKQRHSMARKGVRTIKIKSNGIKSKYSNIGDIVSEKTIKKLNKLEKEQNDLTTSDLQGIVMALSIKELNNHGVDTKSGKNIDKVMELSNDMLRYIYNDYW